jgi:outer membrane protein OmpA-like peptidoglycan-associated protein
MTRLHLTLAGALALALAACGGAAPRPAELDTLDNLRKQPLAQAAAKRSPKMMGEVESLRNASLQMWRGGNLEDSRRDALMGWVKLKLAMTLAEREAAKQREAAADAQAAKDDSEYAAVNAQLADVNEKIALYEKLAAAKSSASSASEKLSVEEAKSNAQAKVLAAELALKKADTVEAGVNAKVEYASASDMLARAQQELKDGNYSAAGATAELAQKKAEQAEAAARPVHNEASAAAERKLRSDALAKDAAAVPGVTVRVEREGELTRLVLVFGGAFKAKKSTIVGKENVLDALAALLKKYPSYPVQLLGHTDSRGSHDALIIVSQARAHAVYEALIARGVEGKRFVVTAMGPDSPLAGQKAYKDVNNRVEIVFLYQ